MAERRTRALTDRQELSRLIEAGLTVQQVAERLGISPAVTRRRIDEFGLPQPIDLRRQDVAAALELGARTIQRHCKRHGSTAFALVGSNRRPRCKRCRAEAVARRRKKVKRILVDEAGGKCLLCGYSRCLSALEFHHVDPAAKEFGVAMRGVIRAIADVRREVRKCVLLCANCHAEVEAGEAKVSLQWRPRR